MKTAEQVKSLKQCEEFIEKLYGRPLIRSEKLLFYALANEIEMPTENIMALWEHCYKANKESKTTLTNIRKIAMEMIEKDIISLSDTKNYLDQRLNKTDNQGAAQ